MRPGSPGRLLRPALGFALRLANLRGGDRGEDLAGVRNDGLRIGLQRSEEGGEVAAIGHLGLQPRNSGR